MVPRLHSTTGYRYGWFEAKIKLPKGKNLWPAFWMWAWDSWPPEIDIFEGYTTVLVDDQEVDRFYEKQSVYLDKVTLHPNQYINPPLSQLHIYVNIYILYVIIY